MRHRNELIKKIKSKKPKKIFLQVPEGLKKRIFDIVDKLDCEVVVSGDKCFGGCDLRIAEAKMTGCDLYVHVGHEKFCCVKDMDVMYYPWKRELEFDNWDALNNIKENKIGLISSVQYVDELEKVKDKLEERGKEAVIGGSVLGCRRDNVSRIRDAVEAFLLVGSGQFHGLPVKDCYLMDVEHGRVVSLRKDYKKMKSIQQWNIEECKNKNKFAVLVCSKPGQYDMETGVRIRDKLKAHGRDAYIVVMDEITDNNLNNIPADAFINTGCPRIIEDVDKIIIDASSVDKIMSATHD